MHTVRDAQARSQGFEGTLLGARSSDKKRHSRQGDKRLDGNVMAFSLDEVPHREQVRPLSLQAQSLACLLAGLGRKTLQVNTISQCVQLDRICAELLQ